MDSHADEQAFLAAISRFSERCLPSRGWSRVLEVGAGSGDRSKLLAERGYVVTVAEPDDAALGHVRGRLEDEGLDASYVTVDALESLGEFDVVLCFDPSLVAPERIRAHLRRGGLLFAGPGFEPRSGYAFDRKHGAFRARRRLLGR